MDEIALKQLKSAARQAAAAKRDALSADDRDRFSQAICDNLVDHMSIEDGAHVGLFLPIKSEIETMPMVDALRARGFQLALPVTIGRTGMVFRQWNEGDELVDAGFGTRGPGPHAPEVKPNRLVMPLLAFDQNGNRLGYGAGHYDRYISERILEGERPQLIGLAFSVQQLDKVPIGRYDLPLDLIVTEKSVIQTQV